MKKLVLSILVILFSTPIANAEVFKVVFITDTHLPLGDTRLENINTWIVANATDAEENIKFVLHGGDIPRGEVQYYGDQAILNQSASDMAILQATGGREVPYMVAPGNHEYNSASAGYGDNKTINRFLTAYPLATFTNMTGATDAVEYDTRPQNRYSTFTVDGETFLVLAMDHCPTQDSVTWVDDVLDNNTDKTVILLQHMWQRWTGGVKNNNLRISQSYEEYPCTGATISPEEIYQSVIKNYPNVLFVLSGHSWNEDTIPVNQGGARTIDIVNGQAINQLRTNWQYYLESANAYIRIIELDTESDVINVTGYEVETGVDDKDYRETFTISRTKNIGYLNLTGVGISGITTN